MILSPDIPEIAQQALEEFTQGLNTGQWEGFLNLLTDDFTFYFPVGAFQGKNVGKARAAEFFHYVSDKIFPEGLSFTVERITQNDSTVVFEGKSEGQMLGYPYQNQVALSFDIRGTQICGYREYLSIFYRLN